MMLHFATIVCRAFEYRGGLIAQPDPPLDACQMVCAVGAAVFTVFMSVHIHERISQSEKKKAERRREEEEAARRREQEQATLAARKAAVVQWQDELSQTTLEQLDQKLKLGMLMFSREGRVISVRVVGVPTGYVTVQWSLDTNLPLALRVVGIKNDRVVFEEYAYQGQFIDLYSRGRSHDFEIHAFDGRTDYEPNFSFRIRVPTPEQFARTVAPALPPPLPPPVDETALRKERIEKRIAEMAAEDALWLEARKKDYDQIDALPISDAEKRQMKAATDARRIEEREKENGG